MANSTGRISERFLAMKVEELKDDLIRLRKRVVTLEAKVHAQSDGDDVTVIGVEAEIPVRKPGRPPDPPDEQLKDRLFQMLLLLKSPLWPRLKDAIHQAKNSDELAALLKKNFADRERIPSFQKLLQLSDDVWEFMTSDRYPKEPKALAQGLAGIPPMTLRSSYDRCQELPPIDLPVEVFETNEDPHTNE
jgi:hypothetical protein